MSSTFRLTGYLIILFTGLPLQAAGNQCGDIGSTGILLGHWRSQSNQQLISESWQLVDAKNRSGIGTTQKLGSNKAPFIETLRIVEMSGEVFFLAKTPQNQMPVAFKLIECSENSIKFENNQHDFPTSLEYQKVSATQLKAMVRGADGKGFDIDFTSQLPTNNLQLVQAYVDAYNQKNIDAMLQYADEQIKWMSVSGQTVAIETKNKMELKAALSKSFNGSDHGFSAMVALIENNPFVSGIEKASWQAAGQWHSQCSPVVYEFEEKKIKNVWYFSSTDCE
jgi:hypothetical protein